MKLKTEILWYSEIVKTNTNNYEYLEYSLPEEDVESYISRAVKILKDINTLFPEFYDSFRCPSEVLALSGARAFDTYYELGTGASRKKIDENWNNFS